jgi:hypothetical protein
MPPKKSSKKKTTPLSKKTSVKKTSVKKTSAKKSSKKKTSAKKSSKKKTSVKKSSKKKASAKKKTSAKKTSAKKKKKKRTFVLVGVKKPAQEFESTSHKKSTFKALTPSAAASKAFTKTCNSKEITGVCTLVIVVREVFPYGRGEGKVYAYTGKREKNVTPVVIKSGPNKGKELTFKYQNKLSSTSVPKFVHTKVE